MKKYEVTEKHAILKEGLILNETSYEYRCKWGHIITNTEIKDWVKCGWIEEIQQKEFTKDDMNHAFRSGINYEFDRKKGQQVTCFDNWLKEYKK